MYQLRLQISRVLQTPFSIIFRVLYTSFPLIWSVLNTVVSLFMEFLTWQFHYLENLNTETQYLDSFEHDTFVIFGVI